MKTTTYDAVGRAVSMLYADGKRVTLQYDVLGRRTTMIDWGGTTTYGYSARGELTGKTVPGGWSLTMVYDAVGNRATLVETTGYAYTYGYDALNRCIRLRDPNAYVFTFQYDAAGRRTTLLDSTGVLRVYAYDPVGRLTTQVDYDASSNPIVTFIDAYDAVGNRVGRLKDGVATTWVYDDAYRLTGQQMSGQTATFVYDAAGNILSKWHEGSSPMSMTFDAANRLLTMQQGATLGTYTYDNNGSMTVEHIAGLGLRNTFVYDQENRQLEEIRVSGVRHTYTYEPDGLRRSAFHAGTADVVTFIWDGDDLLNERIEGVHAARYAVLDGEVLSEKRGASRYRFVPDPLGSVRALLDTSGSIVATRDYWPYGEVAAQSGGMTALQFVGALGYFTDTTNRIYVRARHYRPDLGRWVTVDPIGLAGGDWNLYGYVGGSPIGPVDPAGTQFAYDYSMLGCDCNRTTTALPRSDRRYHCYDEACRHFCLALTRMLARVSNECRGPLHCAAVHSQFGECVVPSIEWAICGMEVIVPGGFATVDPIVIGPIVIRPGGNVSNFPKPTGNFFGTPAFNEYCCVECKMRLCCDFLDRTDLVGWLRRKLARCDGRH